MGALEAVILSAVVFVVAFFAGRAYERR